MLKNKKILTIVISAVFALITVLVGFLIFTLEKVNLTCEFANKNYDFAKEINDCTSNYVGSNLIFLNTEKVKEEIEKNPYLYVESIEKSFPNQLKVVVKDRKDVYLLDYQGKKYFLSENGLVLSEVNRDYQERELISLKFEGEISVKNVTVGKVLEVSDKSRLDLAFSLAKSVGLTDCVKAMTIKTFGTTDIDQTGYDTDIVFDTYTDVKITIAKAEKLGEEKMDKAFKAYQNSADYIKSSNTIYAFYNLQDNKVEIRWGWEL